VTVEELNDKAESLLPLGLEWLFLECFRSGFLPMRALFVLRYKVLFDLKI
jgi:hypothetical protein